MSQCSLFILFSVRGSLRRIFHGVWILMARVMLLLQAAGRCVLSMACTPRWVILRATGACQLNRSCSKCSSKDRGTFNNNNSNPSNNGTTPTTTTTVIDVGRTHSASPAGTTDASRSGRARRAWVTMDVLGMTLAHTGTCASKRCPFRTPVKHGGQDGVGRGRKEAKNKTTKASKHCGSCNRKALKRGELLGTEGLKQTRRGRNGREAKARNSSREIESFKSSGPPKVTGGVYFQPGGWHLGVLRWKTGVRGGRRRRGLVARTNRIVLWIMSRGCCPSQSVQGNSCWA